MKLPIDPESTRKVARFKETLENGKGLNVVELAPDNGAADAMLVVTATSRKHAQGLADALTTLCREEGIEFLGLEGYERGDWILVDCNDIVTQIFLEETRELYNLETLWSKRPRTRETQE